MKNQYVIIHRQEVTRVAKWLWEDALRLSAPHLAPGWRKRQEKFNGNSWICTLVLDGADPFYDIRKPP